MAPTVLDKIMQVIKEQNTPGQRWKQGPNDFAVLKMCYLFT